MKKFVLAGLLGLVAWFAPEAQAQFFYRQPTTPPTRPFSTDPRVQLYGVPQSTYGLFPQGVPPAGSTSAFQSAFANRTTGQASQSSDIDPGSPNITGHPTRFAAYSGYFSNQGGGSSATPPASNQFSRTAPSTTIGGGSASRPASTPASGTKSSSTPRR